MHSLNLINIQSMGALVLLETEQQVSLRDIPTEAACCFPVKRDNRQQEAACTTLG